jgi:hypothetical protein
MSPRAWGSEVSELRWPANGCCGVGAWHAASASANRVALRKPNFIRKGLFSSGLGGNCGQLQLAGMLAQGAASGAVGMTGASSSL